MSARSESGVVFPSMEGGISMRPDQKTTPDPRRLCRKQLRGEPNMSKSNMHRRDFLADAARWGTTACLATAAVETARGYMSNDTVEVACLGTGGRCRQLMKSLAEVPGVRLAAVCDCWD